MTPTDPTPGFVTTAAADLYRDTITNRHGIATMGWLNNLAVALHAIEAEAAERAAHPPAAPDLRDALDLVGLATDELRDLAHSGWSSLNERKALDHAESFDRAADRLRAAHPPAALREALMELAAAEVMSESTNPPRTGGQAITAWVPAYKAEAILRAALSPAPTPVEPPVDDLGAAWGEAEAEWSGSGFPLSVTANRPLRDDFTAAAAMTEADGSTPAAALRSLAARLAATKAGPS